jgi:hypothetical protein
MMDMAEKEAFWSSDAGGARFPQLADLCNGDAKTTVWQGAGAAALQRALIPPSPRSSCHDFPFVGSK